MENEMFDEYWLRRARNSYIGCGVSAIGAALLLFVLLVLALTSCATPKVLEEHHHHYSAVDTMAVQAQMDRRLQSVREQMVHEVRVAVETQLNEQSTTENSKERITETITTWVDSLGREMRQEQRTTERDISRQQQLREERMRQAYEERLMTAVDSLAAVWHERFDSVQAHREEADSASVHQAPAPGDRRPWWKRWRDAMKWMVLGAVACGVAAVARRMWGK